MTNQHAVEDMYPLSPLQEGLLFHCLYEQGQALYVTHITCTLDLVDHIDAFRRAWQKVVDRHAALRTAFAWEGIKQPVQIVSRNAKSVVVEEDLRHMSDQQRQARLEEYSKQQESSDLHLSRAPLLRLTLFRL